MVAAPLILAGDLTISDQNNWRGGGGPEQKIKFGGGGPKFKGESMNIFGKGDHTPHFLDQPPLF